MQAANGSVVEGKDSVSFFSSFVGTGGESMDAPQGVASPSASHNHQHSLSTATITVILPATPSKTSSPIAMAMESEQQQQLNPSPNHEHVENEDEPGKTVLSFSSFFFLTFDFILSKYTSTHGHLSIF